MSRSLVVVEFLALNLAFQPYEVSARGPLVPGGVAAILAFVSIAAAFVPAQRATTVDPMIALRAP